MASHYDENELRVYSTESGVDDAWARLRKDCPALTDWGTATLRGGLDPYAKTLLLERSYVCRDHRNLFSNFYSKRFVTNAQDCARIHFFDTPGVTLSQIASETPAVQNSYIGYSVIRPVSERCLGRTILDPAKIGKGYDHNYFLLRTAYQVRINGAQYKVQAYPYMSQDTDATVCAHSALWGVCRYLSERYPTYRELYPYDLIRLTESREGRTVPYRGMLYTDYCKILSDFGAYPVVRRLKKRNQSGDLEWDPEAFKDTYSLVESGFPVLASVGGHVVTLIGHTFDPQKTVPNGEDFIDSSHFCSQFVVVDDNRFPYQLLGAANDLLNYSSKYNLSSIQVVTCPLPEKVFLAPKEARIKAVEHCKKVLPTLKRTAKPPFVTRMFVTTSNAFKRAKLRVHNTLGDPIAGVITRLHLPHFLWIMEISPLELYRKGRVMAELVLDPTAGLREDGTIYMRTENEFKFMQPKPLAKIFEQAPKEFAQYSHNLGEPSMI